MEASPATRTPDPHQTPVPPTFEGTFWVGALPLPRGRLTVGLMSLWGRVFAAGYDKFMAGTEKAGLADHRKKLLERARGRVLEVGGGTGANLPFYGNDVEEVVVTEPEEPMARRLERKVGDSSVPARVVRAPAEQLPFEDASFDFVVSTLVLCTVSDPARALAEIHRVLKPEGQLLFVEHVRSDSDKLARWQDRLNGINKRVGHGCNCNRRTLENIEGAGFSIADIEHDRLPKAPPFVRPLIVGAAERI
jgi:ubiquinone/menaquinone biosynthesis C-methylase UbiE